MGRLSTVWLIVVYLSLIVTCLFVATVSASMLLTALSWGVRL
jgi:hypothetical protein